MSDKETVDKYAREKIDRLERRLEGAHLTPGIWVITKQAIQAVATWKGWEVFGIGSFVFLGLALLVGLVTVTTKGCDAAQRASDAPSCEAMGLTYTSTRGNGNIVCTGSDRIVTIVPGDIDETEVQMLDDSR